MLAIRSHYAHCGFNTLCFACKGKTQGFRRAPAVCHGDRILGFLCARCSRLPVDLLSARIRKELDRKVHMFSMATTYPSEARRWAVEYAEFRRLAEGEIVFELEDLT